MADAFGIAASSLAVVELCLKVAISCTQYLREVSNASSDIERIQHEITGLKNVTESVNQLLDESQGPAFATAETLRDTLRDSKSRLNKLLEDLEPSITRKAMKRFGLRALKWPFKSKDIDKVIHDLSSFTQTMILALKIDGSIMAIETERKRVLDKLPTADGATFDSHAEEHYTLCLQNTRVDLMREITEWVQNPEAKSCFWLNGMAGTGKSTIARTLARSFEKDSLGAKEAALGASFFFKRGEGDRGDVSKFFSTIASQLVKIMPETAGHIQSAIDRDPAIAGKSMPQQFEKLIMTPLTKASSPAYENGTLLIIIDALDECEQKDDAKLILKLLSGLRNLRSPKIRIFCTSRPELPLRWGFKDIHGTYQDLTLHEIAKSVIKHDIEVFFQHRLSKIRCSYNNNAPQELQLSSSWPTPSDFQELVEMAVPLFIFAATVSLFIEEHRFGSPDDQLKKILKYRTKSQVSQLGKTYLPVLHQMISGLDEKSKAEVLHRFRNVVGSIVVLGTPLSTRTLAQLLDIPLSQVLGLLDVLHSVLSVPSKADTPIKTFHLSFRDFLVGQDEPENSPFRVDEKETHKYLARHCLRVMKRSLHVNICDIQNPGTPSQSIDKNQIKEKLPPEVQYACCFWSYHLVHGMVTISDEDEVHTFLKSHFTHWLEALSLIGMASQSIQAVKLLQSLVKENSCQNISEFLDDAALFLLSSISIIQEAPLQLYSSALAFAPKRSVIRSNFEYELASWLALTPNVPLTWSPCLQTLESPSYNVSSFTLSNDSKIIASGTEDGDIHIWKVETGTLQQTIHAHKKTIRSIAFSHDSSLLATASCDLTVKIWSVDMGNLQRTFESHDGEPSSVTFSHDSKFLAASSDSEINIWESDTGKLHQEIRGHEVGILSVRFSHDSKLLVSGARDSTVRVWDVETGKLRQLLASTNWVNSVTFSHNSEFIASGSEALMIWDAGTGKLRHSLQHQKQAGPHINSVEFSHDSKFLVTGSMDKTARIWATHTGELRQTFKGHSKLVTSVAFSHDSKLIVSASEEVIRVWSTDPGKIQQDPEEHTGQITSFVFSYDSRFVASVAEDNTVCIWAADTGKLLHALRGHEYWVISASFSHDSKLIATSSFELIQIWVVKTGQLHQTICVEDSDLRSVIFSRDSRFIAAESSEERAVKLWDVDTGKLHCTIKQSDRVRAIALSDDLKFLATVRYDDYIDIRFVETGELQRQLQSHVKRVASITFSHDSTLVKLVSKSNMAHIWAVGTGELLQTVDIRLFQHDQKRLGVDYASGKEISRHSLETKGNDLITRNFPPDEILTLSENSDHNVGYGISSGKRWITWNGKNLLWLPVECRAECSRSIGSTVVMGSRYGKVLFLHFDQAKITLLV